MSEKGWVPLRYWLMWWSSIVVAIGAFYVVLTPVWMGLRAIAWIADLRQRHGRLS